MLRGNIPSEGVRLHGVALCGVDARDVGGLPCKGEPDSSSSSSREAYQGVEVPAPKAEGPKPVVILPPGLASIGTWSGIVIHSSRVFRTQEVASCLMCAARDRALEKEGKKASAAVAGTSGAMSTVHIVIPEGLIAATVVVSGEGSAATDAKWT